MRNGRPLRPARICEKKTGPRLSTLIAAATTRNTGESRTSASVLLTTSRVRFSNKVERERSPVLYSRTGSSARCPSRTAALNAVRPGGTMLRSTLRSRTVSTMFAVLSSSRDAGVTITRSTPASHSCAPLSSSSRSERSSTMVMWRSGKSSSFRFTDVVLSAVPTIATRSGGVTTRQHQRALARNATAEKAATVPAMIALDASGLLGGSTSSKSESPDIPISAQRAICGISSTVRCRSARPSASYSPSSFAITIHTGRKKNAQASSPALPLPSTTRETVARSAAPMSAHARNRRRRTYRHVGDALRGHTPLAWAGPWTSAECLSSSTPVLTAREGDSLTGDRTVTDIGDDVRRRGRRPGVARRLGAPAQESLKHDKRHCVTRRSFPATP